MATLDTKAPLIVIVGESASGKSRLALDLAIKFNGEIISADSVAVYTGFDIGTAKPTTKDKQLVQHRLIDVVEPGGSFSVADFKKLADLAITEISRLGKVPIMVGGSGLYVDSVLFDFSFRPKTNTAERLRLDTKSNEQLISEAKRLGLTIDGIDAANNRRLIRFIETNGATSAKNEIRQNTLVLGQMIDRQQLYKNIEDRVDSMLKDGLEKEVRQLVAEYGWNVEPMKSIGYREFEQYLDGKITIDQTRDAIILDTKHLAKKQRTWFKRNNSIHWVSEQQQAVDLVTTFLNNYRR